MAGRRHVLIIGGGYSGVALTLALLRRDAPNLDITLVEAGNKLGRGLAYATERDFCLLNSPAGSMSIMPDDPLHFVRWLQANGIDATPHTFARRHDFGTYIEDSLIRAIDDRWRARSRLRLRIGTGAREVVPQPTGFTVVLDDGERFACNAVVLAAGHLPVGDPLASCLPATAARYLRAPQDEEQLAAIAAGDSVLLLGTGLTMVDVALTLHRNGHRAPIHAISRRGLLPQAHEHDAVPLPATLAMKLAKSDRLPLPASESARAAAAGGPGGTSRHRLAIRHRRGSRRNAALLVSFADCGTAPLRTPAAPVLGNAPASYGAGRLGRDQAAAAKRPAQDPGRSDCACQGSRQLHPCRAAAARVRPALEYRYDWVVQCTGPGASEARGAGVIGRLLELDLLRHDALGLGLESASDGTAIGNHGRTPGLYLLGPARRPYDWEQTAAPELRQSAERLAATLESDWIGGRMPIPAVANPEQRLQVQSRTPA